MFLILIIVLAFLFGLLLVLGMTAPTANQNMVLERIDRITRGGMVQQETPSAVDAELDDTFSQRIYLPALRRLASIGWQLTPSGGAQTLRNDLIRAGNPGNLGVAEFSGLRLINAVIFVCLAGMTFHLLPWGSVLNLIFAVFVLFVGILLPDFFLQRAIAKRQAMIRKSLPDAIDLLVISVEAGMGFDGAVAKVVEKMRGPLPVEFGRVLQEMRLGQARGQALKDMAERVNVQELTTFVAAIYQADQLGVSIANVLRVQSETVRVMRLQRIREAAAKLPVTMLFPLALFIFPALFIVVLGPAVLRIFDAFTHM